MSVSDMGAAPTVVLDTGSDSTIPIYVGLWEAISINNALNSEMLPRPITHDLIVDLFRRFDITLDALHIDSLEEGLYAKLLLSQGSRTRLDCRPSDGMLLLYATRPPS